MPDLRQWPGADALLDAALERPPDERDAFLAREAAGDDALLQALRAVLAEAQPPDSFLEPGAAASAALLAAGDEPDDAPPPALAPGDRVGVYEVVAALGYGGMGEVYRARDTQLGRDVALKVPRASRRTDLVARLERESRLLASLNHPNVAAIYGLAESRGIPALVLELVEGPTLAERLQGGRIPVDEAIGIASQIAAALEAAHARGIAHRDLKPANVKLAPGGRVKVLDFGLAKALAGGDEPDEHRDLTAAARLIGVVFGTAAYMSPEQARSAPVDHRADIWALGCIVFEMLTGRRAFEGRTVTEVLARILEREPDMSLLPAGTPPSLRRLLRRCLEKDRDRRFADVRDAALDLEDARSELAAGAGRAGHAIPVRQWRLLAAAALVIGAIIVARLPWKGAAPAAPTGPVRLALGVPASDEFVTGFQPVPAISPDGRLVVYRARRDGVVRLFRRSLDALAADAMAGTEQATGAFFSPDGRWLAFDGDGVLKKVRLDGTATTDICAAPGGATGTWVADDTIVFATNTSRVLRRVSAGGGEPVDLTRLDVAAGDVQHAWPDALPDGRAVLFTVVRTRSRHIAAVSLPSGEVTMITTGTQPRYLSSGHLAFARDSAVWIAPFDSRRLAMTGEAEPVVQQVEGSETSSVHFDVSRSGTLVYLPARDTPALRRLVWAGRDGAESPVALPPRVYRSARISPDGTRLAMSVTESDNSDIWVAHLASGAATRLTFEPTVESAPIWSRDGRFVVFRSERGGGGMFRRTAAGTGEVERLTPGGGPIETPGSFVPGDRVLLFTEFHGFRQQSIARVDLAAGERRIEPLLDGQFAQLRPELSADGRWLAYQSDESGRFEVYVRPYPDLDAGRWQISHAGGTTPRWRRDGKEIFFFDGGGIAVAAISPGPPFRAAPARRLVEAEAGASRLGPEFDVAADGDRVLLIRDAPQPSEATGRRDLILVQDWRRSSF